MGESAAAVPLGEIVDLQRGTTYKSALLGLPGPVLLGLASIERNGGFRSDSLKTYGGESPAKLLLRPGDLYISLKDVTQAGDLLGAVSRVPESVPLGRLTQDTVKLTFKLSRFPPDYLYWLLRTPTYRDYCRARAIGTTNLSLSRDDFLAFPVPLPRPHQMTIVETLTALDDKIELNRRLSEALEATARTLFRSWFVDFDSPQASGADDWVSGALWDLADLNPEVWPTRDRPSMLRYIDLSGTKWGRIKAVTDYPADEAPSRAQRILRPGDTIVGTVRPGNGSYALVTKDGLTGSTGFAQLRPKRPRDAAFVYLAATARANIDALEHLADGGAYPAVRPSLVAATPVVVPDDRTLQAFSVAASPHLKRAAIAIEESEVLGAMRDALLPRLLSGSTEEAA